MRFNSMRFRNNYTHENGKNRICCARLWAPDSGERRATNRGPQNAQGRRVIAQDRARYVARLTNGPHNPGPTRRQGPHVETEITPPSLLPVSYTHLRAHETRHDLVCRLLL